MRGAALVLQQCIRQVLLSACPVLGCVADDADGA
jgi:hypothetical protein